MKREQLIKRRKKSAKEKARAIGITVKPFLFQKLIEFAQKQNRSISNSVEVLLMQALETFEREEEKNDV